MWLNRLQKTPASGDISEGLKCLLGEYIKNGAKEFVAFTQKEIDKLIDSSQQHDTARYDGKIFLEQIEYVASRYGEKGIECYLLHHLLDRLKDELVSIKSRHNEIDLEYVERILNWLKPEPMQKIRKYDALWSHLILKLKPELKEVVKDIISEEGFKRSFRKSIVNKRVASWVKVMLESLPPCILVESADRVLINSRVLKAVWCYIYSYGDISLDDKMIIAQIKKCIAAYISEKRLYKEKSCRKECKLRLLREEKWRQFVKSLRIPCPELNR